MPIANRIIVMILVDPANLSIYGHSTSTMI